METCWKTLASLSVAVEMHEVIDGCSAGLNVRFRDTLKEYAAANGLPFIVCIHPSAPFLMQGISILTMR